MLERPDRNNLFLSPPDAQRQWYRYHQMFADALRARVRAKVPARRPDLPGLDQAAALLQTAERGHHPAETRQATPTAGSR